MIAFVLIVLIVLAVVVWAFLAYLRAGTKAADEGIDRDQDNVDAGHV